MRRGLALGLVGLCAASAAGLGTAAARQPRLAISDPVPLTVRGTGFLARERVTITASVRVTRIRSAVADSAGRFTVRFAALSVQNGCLSYFVKAVGERGTRAVLKVRTVCPPPGPTTPPELQPPDR